MRTVTLELSNEAAARLDTLAASMRVSLGEYIRSAMQEEDVLTGVDFAADGDTTAVAEFGDDPRWSDEAMPWFNWPEYWPEPLCSVLLDNGDIVQAAYRGGRWEGVGPGNDGRILQNVLSFLVDGVGVVGGRE